MPAWRRVAFLVVLAGVSAAWLTAARPPVTILDNTRIIVGDGRVVERGALRIENGRIASIDAEAPSRPGGGAVHVDATGKTIMPVLVDGHVHLGFQVGTTFAAANYSRATLIDQLNRYAYAGIGAVLSMGTDAGDVPLQLRADQAAGRVGGARFLFAGRGLAAPNAGPATPELKPTAYGVETEAQARQYVRDLIAENVDVIKIWVDDRSGTVQKLSPVLYRAIIDEAHRHRARVVAHVFYLDDAKDLARAGIDAFAHLVRDREVDDELIALLRQHRVLVMPNIAINENGIHAAPPRWLDDPLVADVVADDAVARLRDSYGRRTPDGVARARATYERMQHSLARMNRAGVAIGFGTDDGAVRDHFYAVTPHRELRLMAEAGMTPAQVITAATRTTAEFLRLRDLGTLAPGKSADFIVLDGNPLDDLANTTRIDRVYRAGVPLDRPAMRAAFR